MIVWVLGPGDNARRQQYIVNTMNKVDPVAARSIKFVYTNKLQQYWVKKPKTKETFMLTNDYAKKIAYDHSAMFSQATVIVCNEFALLAALLAKTGGHGNKKKLKTYRGSLYYSKITHQKPTIVLDDVSKAYIPPKKNPVATQQENAMTAHQFNVFDMSKIARFFHGTDNRLYGRTGPRVPKFEDSYELLIPYANTQANPAHRDWWDDNPDYAGSWFMSKMYNDFLAWVNRQSVIAIDFETTLNYVSCFSVTGIEDWDVRTIKTYTVPFIDTCSEAQQWMNIEHWDRLHKELCTSEAVKLYANGSYDWHYHIKYHGQLNGQVEDVMHMWHSYRPRLPKSLATIASVMYDEYYYWKDEIKGGSTEKKTQTKYALPVTKEGLNTYWEYAGKDTFATLITGLRMMQLMHENPWALENYAKEMALQMGPLMKASYMGCRLDTKRLRELNSGSKDDAMKALQDIEIASNGIVTGNYDEANNKISGCTDAQCATWLYDVLCATPPMVKGKKTRSVDQRQLRLVSEQHPFFDRAIELIREVREPQKQNSMYSNMKTLPDRFNYKYSIMSTYTGRLGGKASDFWVGTNPQNVPKEMRQFVTADLGKVMIDNDYEQADLYHFAVAVGDQNMIRNVFDDRDTHAVHVEMILQVPYEEVVAGKKSGDAFVVHPITGVRQIIKKVTHGGNYGMSPPTAYLNIGKESLVAAAGYLGRQGTAKWTYSKWLDFTEELTVPYFAEYPGQKAFRKKVVDDCRNNNGLATCFGGLTVYFEEWDKPKEHQNLMRALLAFYGQGGTAGMINNSMLGMYYPVDEAKAHALWEVDKFEDTSFIGSGKSFLEHNEIDLLLQTHDSFNFQAAMQQVLSKNIINDVLIAMQVKCKFNGIDYIVPCESEVGFRWSKNMVSVSGRTVNETTLAVLEAMHKENMLAA